jgi:SNF2 family DNA or RNA helicase
VSREITCDKCDGVGCVKCYGSGKITKQHPIPSSESGKLSYLMERLDEQGISADKDDQEGESLAIVASQFKEVANMVHAYLNSKGIASVLITGDTKQEDRDRYQMMFRQDGKRTADSPRVIVMTTTAGGVAITLDLVENVHILDETWVPDDQEQLADRAVNTSRMHQVGVYVYRSRNTVEHHIQSTNIDKRDINRRILDLRRQGFRATMKEAMAV